MASPFDFLKQEELVVISLGKMERAIDRAIKSPMEFVRSATAETERLVHFSQWLKVHSRHRVPVTYKSEWAILVAVMLEWPGGQDGFLQCSLDSFRATMRRLCRAMQSKCFHRHYLF